jgi:pilus assembly protein CpaC
MTTSNKRFRTCKVLALLVSILFSQALLAEQKPSAAKPAKHSDKAWYVLNSNDNRNLDVTLYKSKVLQFRENISKVSIANPDIADIIVVNPRQMYVLGKALGTTNILVLDASEKLLATINLDVKHDLDSLQENLRRLLPNEQVLVSSSQGSITLSGEVSGISAVKSAMALAKSFLPHSKGLAKTKGTETIEGSKVINLLKVAGAQQVMLEVQVAEVSRQFLKSVDANFNILSSSNTKSPSNPVDGLFASFTHKNLMLHAALNAAKERGLAKVLSQPILTTLSGHEASFISGGEVPVPIPGDNGKVGIVYKEYGVALKFLPIVLDNKRINLKLDLSVSELSNGNSVTVTENETATSMFIPSIRKRSVQSTVELADGQTLGIAGMISDNTRGNISKFPGLAKLPVIGMLFRSQEFIKGQTELVIFVTPHFAQPAHAKEYSKPTQFYVEPNDNEFFIKGKLEAK